MEKATFNYCCGAEELGNLHALTTATLRNDLKHHAKYVQQAIDGGYGDDFPGAYIATTIPSQRKAIRALEANKFRKVFTFTNPGTGSRVTLWAKKLVR